MKKTKKLLAGIAVSSIVLLSGVSVFAAGSNNKKNQTSRPAQGTNYVDADNDGICDNIGTAQGTNYMDADNDGICDNIGTAQGTNYVDADNDGICDNIGTGGTRPQDGTGLKSGNGNAANKTQGSNYVDADNDGICDNIGTGGARPQDGSGRQNGRRR